MIYDNIDIKDQRVSRFLLQSIMSQADCKYKIDVFSLNENAWLTKKQVLRIRNRFISVVKQDTCPECCKCQKMLAKIIFVCHQNDCYCIDCFQKIKEKQRQAFVFIDLSIKDPKIPDWKLSQELELLHLTHQYGVEDTELLAESMTIPRKPKTAKDIQSFYEKIQAARPLPLEETEEIPHKDIRKEKWFEIYSDLKEQLEEADTDVLDFILGELHQESDIDIRNFALGRFGMLTAQRAKMYGILEKLAKKYPQRHKHPQILFSSSSDSHSRSDLSINSDSPEFDQLKARCTQILSDVDAIFKRNFERQSQPRLEKKPNVKKEKHVTFVDQSDSDELSPSLSKTKRITRNASKKQIQKGILIKRSKRSEENGNQQG